MFCLLSGGFPVPVNVPSYILIKNIKDRNRWDASLLQCFKAFLLTFPVPEKLQWLWSLAYIVPCHLYVIFSSITEISGLPYQYQACIFVSLNSTCKWVIWGKNIWVSKNLSWQDKKKTGFSNFWLDSFLGDKGRIKEPWKGVWTHHSNFCVEISPVKCWSLSVHYLKRDYCLYFYVFHDLYIYYYATQSQKSDVLYFYLYFFSNSLGLCNTFCFPTKNSYRLAKCHGSSLHWKQ